MHHHKLFLMLLLLCILAAVPIFLFASVRTQRNASSLPNGANRVETAYVPLTVGVILTDQASRYGWENSSASDQDYAVTTINGDQVILFDRLNTTDRPGVTLDDVTAAMQKRGARYVLVDLKRQDIETMLAALPSDKSVVIQPTSLPKPQTTASTSAARSHNGELAALVIVVGFVAFGATIAVRWKNNFGMGTAGSKNKKRRLGTGAHAKALAIERAAAERATNFEAIGQPQPLVHKLSTYVFGDYHFDESFSIELPNGKFLGECGLGITAPISRVDATRITALEVWLFDKNDIRTVTNVLASQHAINDPALRSKLEPKGQVIQADMDAVTVLETRTLRLQARILDIQYGFADSLPMGSFFEDLVLEIAVWQKN